MQNLIPTSNVKKNKSSAIPPHAISYARIIEDTDENLENQRICSHYVFATNSGRTYTVVHLTI